MLKRFFVVFTLISLLLAVGCSTTTNSLPSDIEKEIDKFMNADVIIPKDESLAISYADIMTPEIGDINRSKIVYVQEKGELIKNLSVAKEHLKNQGITLLYGEYEGKKAIVLEISQGKAEIDGAEVTKINNIPVQMATKDHFLFAGLTHKELSYSATFSLSDTFTKDDATKFLEKLTSEMK